MKVTILTNSKGGLFTATMQWAKGLAHKGSEVNMFFLTKSEEAQCLVSSENIHLNYLTISNFLPNLRSLIRFLIHDRPDIIHINFASFGPLAILKKFVFRIPFIYTSHGLPQPWLENSILYKIYYTIEACLLPFTASQSSAIVAVSNYIKLMLKKKYGVDSEVIYHGISAQKSRTKDKGRSKRKLGYNKTDLVILFVGKLHPYKDPLTLVKAVHKAVKTKTNLHLIIIGSGELSSEVEKEIFKLDLANHVKLLEHVNDEKLKTCYDAADIFVLPSLNEAFGMTLLEAMASYLPVIASNSGACPEVIGNAGMLFDRMNHADLAEKIINLAYDQALMKKLSDKGLNRVREVFSWEDKINQYWELYKTVTERQLLTTI